MNEAAFLGTAIPPKERREVARWIAARQGLPKAYGELFAGFPPECDSGIQLFTGERVTSASARHILGEESCRALLLLKSDDASAKAALTRATTWLIERVEKAGLDSPRNNAGTYCCGKCTVGLWRNILAGGLDRQRSTAGTWSFEAAFDAKWQRGVAHLSLLVHRSRADGNASRRRSRRVAIRSRPNQGGGEAVPRVDVVCQASQQSRPRGARTALNPASFCERALRRATISRMSGFLVALAIGVALFLILSRMRAGQAQPSAAVPIQDPSARFQALGAALSSAGDASSHPRDLGTNPTFREAVAILESSDVPMSLVMDYAMGANWMPATVACAALSGRSDRDAASGQIARHFRHLSPWPMSYALAVLHEGLRAAGRRIAGAQWSRVLDAAPAGSGAAGRAFPGSRRPSGLAWLRRLAVRRDARSPDGGRNAAPQDRPLNRAGADDGAHGVASEDARPASSFRPSAASSSVPPNWSCSSSTMRSRSPSPAPRRSH